MTQIHLKRYSLLSVIISIILSMNGCSNNFLKDEPVYMGAFTEPLIVNRQDIGVIQTVTINIPEANNSSYQIRQHPQWMEFQSMSGNFSNGLANINFIVTNYQYGQNEGEIILAIKGLGLVSLNIKMRNSELNSIILSRDIIDFRADISVLQLRAENHASESVFWKIIECPDWAKIEVLNGMLKAQGWVTLDITCDRSNLPQGNVSGQLRIEFDWGGGLSVIKTISMKAEIIPQANSSNMIDIEGIVVDAIYCKETDRLFIATKNPDRILVFDRMGAPISTIPLAKSPSKLSLTEIGQHLFIGHSGLVSFIDSSMQRVSETFEVDFNVFDLAYGENGWLYLSPNVDHTYEPIIVLNLTDKSLLRNKSDNLYGKTHFRKIKDKPLLFATRVDISPSGIILIDISNGIPNKNEAYWHEDIGNRFWFSDDNKYTYGLYGTIFLTPDYNKTDDILPLGRLTLSDHSNWMDYCAQTKSLWVAPDNSWGDKQPYINQYHADNYYLIKTYNLERYTTTINGAFDSYRTVPYYIFSNKNGTRVFAIKNVYINYVTGINAWSMEILTF